jgi:hypothetical protein
MFLINPYILGGGAVGNPLWDGLQAYYTADNTGNDALGTYNGTLTNGATYGTGIISNGFSLDGVNDYVDVSPSLGASLTAPTSSFSYSAWIYKTKSGQAVIVQNGGSNFGCSMSVTSGGYLGLFYGGGSGVAGVSVGTGLINLNTWHHCVVTYDGAGNIAFYKNGSAVDTQTVSWTDGVGTADAWIGSFLGASNYFGGIIDEVGIWNRVLTSSEVTELYNSGAGKQYPN